MSTVMHNDYVLNCLHISENYKPYWSQMDRAPDEGTIGKVKHERHSDDDEEDNVKMEPPCDLTLAPDSLADSNDYQSDEDKKNVFRVVEAEKNVDPVNMPEKNDHQGDDDKECVRLLIVDEKRKKKVDNLMAVFERIENIANVRKTAQSDIPSPSSQHPGVGARRGLEFINDYFNAVVSRTIFLRVVLRASMEYQFKLSNFR